jgi:hypothetical protein
MGSGTSGVRVRDVVRDVVVEVAEEELPIVDGLAGFDDAGALRRLRGRGRRREPLGFGLGEVAALVTPVVWLVVDEIARQVGDLNRIAWPSGTPQRPRSNRKSTVWPPCLR